jgi:hypothetical protein
MINLKSSKTHIDVKPVTNVNITTRDSTDGHTDAKYDVETTETTGEELPPIIQHMEGRKRNVTFKTLTNENMVLKIIINILNSNPLKYNGFIIADDVVLQQLVTLLTEAESVQIDAEDILTGCCTGNTYRKVNAIYVLKNGETLNLKYTFAEVMKQLQDLHISTKYVW